jgi:purine-binding chemotaxis protein CheW
VAEQERVDEVAPAGSPERAAVHRFLTFRLDGRRYALPAGDVSEVMLVPSVARLPHSPRCLMGLANLRGTVIPVIDPRIMLGLAAFAPLNTARAIVLSGAAPPALVVDAVDKLAFIEAERIETHQASLAAEPGEILAGAFPTGDEVTKILDLKALLAIAFGDRPAPRPRAALAPVSDVTIAAAPVERRLLISFEVAGQDYALNLDAVREIIPLPDTISVVPRAEAVLLGVAAWRETLLPLLSLRGLLGFPHAESWTGGEKVFVTVVNGASIGLVADRARALIRTDARFIDPAPSMLSARSGGESRITAIYRGEGGKRLVSLLAPEQLFREDVMRRIGEKLVPAAVPSSVETKSATVQFVVFRLGDEEFGLPIAAVDEVALVPTRMTRVPKMPKFLDGVINLRGEVLPIVDQRRRFEMPKYEGSRRRLIVVRSERHRAGLVVDGVSEVLRTRADAIEPPPDLTGGGARLVNGVINIGQTGRMILLLDPAELLTRSEHTVLDQIELTSGSEG